MIWLALVLLLTIALRRPPWLLARLVVTILMAESISGALKQVFDRPRPPLVDPDPAPLVEPLGSGSFPSGHATVSFACATVIALALPRLTPWVFALAALIAFSRVYVGVHYPADVVAGAILGIAVGFAIEGAALLVRRFSARRVSPRDL